MQNNVLYVIIDIKNDCSHEEKGGKKGLWTPRLMELLNTKALLHTHKEMAALGTLFPLWPLIPSASVCSFFMSLLRILMILPKDFKFFMLIPFMQFVCFRVCLPHETLMLTYTNPGSRTLPKEKCKN